MEKLINFAVEDIEQIQFDDYDEKEFAIAKVGFMSNRPNSHKLEISEEVLRKNVNTVLGKWMVVKMDFMGLDAEGHDPQEHIVGFFPKDQEIEFVEDEEGMSVLTLRLLYQRFMQKITARCLIAITNVQLALK